MRTVATFANPAEAHLLAAHLGGTGIDVVLRDENTIQTDLLLTSSVGANCWPVGERLPEIPPL